MVCKSPPTEIRCGCTPTNGLYGYEGVCVCACCENEQEKASEKEKEREKDRMYSVCVKSLFMESASENVHQTESVSTRGLDDIILV